MCQEMADKNATIAAIQPKNAKRKKSVEIIIESRTQSSEKIVVEVIDEQEEIKEYLDYDESPEKDVKKDHSSPDFRIKIRSPKNVESQVLDKNKMNENGDAKGDEANDVNISDVLNKEKQNIDKINEMFEEVTKIIENPEDKSPNKIDETENDYFNQDYKMESKNTKDSDQ